jgi:hypothetical protein
MLLGSEAVASCLKGNGGGVEISHEHRSVAGTVAASASWLGEWLDCSVMHKRGILCDMLRDVEV